MSIPPIENIMHGIDIFDGIEIGMVLKLEWYGNVGWYGIWTWYGNVGGYGNWTWHGNWIWYGNWTWY